VTAAERVSDAAGANEAEVEAGVEVEVETETEAGRMTWPSEPFAGVMRR
jgi:hypothetical protein